MHSPLHDPRPAGTARCPVCHRRAPVVEGRIAAHESGSEQCSGIGRTVAETVTAGEDTDDDLRARIKAMPLPPRHGTPECMCLLCRPGQVIEPHEQK